MSQPAGRSKLSNRWLLAIVIGVVAYGLSQPYLSAWLGIHLPSLTQFSETTAVNDGHDAGYADSGSTSADLDLHDSGLDDSGRDDPQLASPADSLEDDDFVAGQQSGEKGAAVADEAVIQVDPRTEYLKETPPGSESYLSPQGLRYTRGSQEGHRLKHLERHLADQPNRPGKHGVFQGDMLQVLKWLDDAYARGKRKARGTRERTEDGRTIYEVSFDDVVGYIGGQVGKREGNPQCKKIRLVVEGNRVITAFPF